MRRYIITGAPGAGKTTILAALRKRGYAVVEEAATDVVARGLALGVAPGLPELDAITLLQRRRQQRPVPPATRIQIFDRSPICTLALAHYLGQPVTPTLAGEVKRVVAEQIYQPRVFFVRLLGFVTPTPVRRITWEQTVWFEGFHERAYREHGFELVDVPAGPVEKRVRMIEQCIPCDR